MLGSDDLALKEGLLQPRGQKRNVRGHGQCAAAGAFTFYHHVFVYPSRRFFHTAVPDAANYCSGQARRNDCLRTRRWATTPAMAMAHTLRTVQSISRRGQGFSNYLRDQTMVQNNNVRGTGIVGHAAVWNSTADAPVKSDPHCYEYVNTPNYWNGTDYVP